MKYASLIIILLFFSPIAVCVDVITCSEEQAIAAEGQVSDIHDWERLHIVYKEFYACDDGAISEGFSDSVANLLTNHWGDIGKLSLILNSDPDYRRFIVKHVDMLITEQQFLLIEKNVNSCRNEMKAFCEELIVQLDRIRRESEKIKSEYK